MNVTYLLGAGASYNALPILSELPDRLKKLRDQLARPMLLSKTKPELISNLDWLIDNTNNHQTIDTFARKLFLNSKYHEPLRSLKKLLTIYFNFEQAQILTGEFRNTPDGKQNKETPDKRYDSLIATLLDNDIDSFKLNSNVKILTWNYDIQFEIAYKKFYGNDDLKLSKIHDMLQVVPSNWSTKQKFDDSKFGMVKLNGSALCYNEEIKNVLDDFINLSNPDAVYMELFRIFEIMIERDEETQINYAWENLVPNRFQHKHIGSINSTRNAICAKTEVLVVIGYSFPIFNRSIDKSIINSMVKLKKVYVQDRNPDDIISILKSSFDKFQPPFNPDKIEVKFESTSNVNSFLVPPELV